VLARLLRVEGQRGGYQLVGGQAEDVAQLVLHHRQQVPAAQRRAAGQRLEFAAPGRHGDSDLSAGVGSTNQPQPSAVLGEGDFAAAHATSGSPRDRVSHATMSPPATGKRAAVRAGLHVADVENLPQRRQAAPGHRPDQRG
jgi:hypothetical protein